MLLPWTTNDKIVIAILSGFRKGFQMDTYYVGNDENLPKLGLKKSRISLALAMKDIKRSGRGRTGNQFFNRQDYIPFLLEELVKEKCYTHFILTENEAIMEFCDAESPARFVASMPWSRVNIETRDTKKKLLDPMQEIGAGGSYAKRYLEMWFFDLTESDILYKEIDEFIYNSRGEKLINPPLNIKAEKKIPYMFAWAKSQVPGLKYDEEELIKKCIRKMKEGGFVETDSKKDFPVEKMGALLEIISKARQNRELEFKKGAKLAERIVNDANSSSNN